MNEFKEFVKKSEKRFYELLDQPNFPEDLWEKTGKWDVNFFNESNGDVGFSIFEITGEKCNYSNPLHAYRINKGVDFKKGFHVINRSGYDARCKKVYIMMENDSVHFRFRNTLDKDVMKIEVDLEELEELIKEMKSLNARSSKNT